MRKKMENNNRILVDRKWIVYLDIERDVVKLDCDDVVRLYKKCESIGEGLLGWLKWEIIMSGWKGKLDIGCIEEVY